MRKKMWHHKRGSMQLDRDMGHNNSIKVRVLVSRPHIYSAHDTQHLGDVGQSVPRIYATLDDKHVGHQASIIDMDGKLCDQLISMLIDLGSNYSYVSPKLVDTRGLSKELHVESWLVKLATGMKNQVHHWVRVFSFDLNGMPTATNLNVLQLGSYNMLLGMDCILL